ALSLLLCVATVTAWIRSATISEEWTVHRLAALGRKGNKIDSITFVPFRCSLEIHLSTVKIADVHALFAEFRAPEDRIAAPGWEFSHRIARSTYPPDRETMLQELGFAWEHGGFSSGGD